MKKDLQFITLSFILIFFSSCMNSITGTGETTMATRNIENFSAIELNLNADIILTDSNVNSLMISAQENLMPVITMVVKSDKLIISSDKNILESKPITIYLSVNRLQALELNGSGNVRSTNTLKTGSVRLELNGSGTFDLDVVCDKLIATISGSGRAILKGSGNQSNLDISGSGVIESYGFRSGNCQVEVSGSGQANVTATSELKASVSGSGSIQYQGNPTNIIPSVSGSGSIVKSE